jgi:hypothetical protein
MSCVAYFLTVYCTLSANSLFNDGLEGRGTTHPANIRSDCIHENGAKVEMHVPMGVVARREALGGGQGLLDMELGPEDNRSRNKRLPKIILVFPQLWSLYMFVSIV